RSFTGGDMGAPRIRSMICYERELADHDLATVDLSDHAIGRGLMCRICFKEGEAPVCGCGDHRRREDVRGVLLGTCHVGQDFVGGERMFGAHLSEGRGSVGECAGLVEDDGLCRCQLFEHTAALYDDTVARSEERRVGKECRSWW